MPETYITVKLVAAAKEFITELLPCLRDTYHDGHLNAIDQSFLLS